MRWAGRVLRGPERFGLILALGAVAVVAAATVVAVIATRPGKATVSLVQFFDVGPASWASPGPDDSDDSGVAAVTYQDGGLLRYAFAIRNDGPEATTITEVLGAPPPAETLLRPVALGLAAEGARVDGAVGVSSGDVLNADENEPDVEPFHPFVLARGEERVVWVWSRMTDCEWYLPGSAETLVGVRVRYTVDGSARDTDLRLPLGVRVSLPNDYRCPRPHPSRTAPASG